MISRDTHKNGVTPWWDIRGLSTDTKPTEGVPSGSTYIEIDTGKGYLFDSVGSEWHELPAGGSVIINPATGVLF